ncbi:Hypothetical protein CINCED_3A005152 [Cinara cedri]|uniref:Uncharacterized protein n=1 Tax=Cinara cedri TaxID=506608 RepID=A0A5E4NLQ1_9HEMI|nr:Hypothetical protein CINCED_3A005152 [Cinara cedri]
MLSNDEQWEITHVSWEHLKNEDNQQDVHSSNTKTTNKTHLQVTLFSLSLLDIHNQKSNCSNGPVTMRLMKRLVKRNNR